MGAPSPPGDGREKDSSLERRGSQVWPQAAYDSCAGTQVCLAAAARVLGHKEVGSPSPNAAFPLR